MEKYLIITRRLKSIYAYIVPGDTPEAAEEMLQPTMSANETVEEVILLDMSLPASIPIYSFEMEKQ